MLIEDESVERGQEAFLYIFCKTCTYSNDNNVRTFTSLCLRNDFHVIVFV